ncbi:MAG: SMC-Scp complex subunit ScpB [Phycisphaeraceae bacterium]
MSDSPSTEQESQAQPAAAAATLDSAKLAATVEAALISSDKPLTSARLAELVAGAGAKAVHAAVDSLNQHYEQTGRAFRIEEVAGGWQIMTLADHAEVLASLHKSRAQAKLSPAGMETLAIIAYKQPVLRADIEAIRGVASGEVVRSLMERRLVKIVGRAEEIGRPMLYGTTRTFLEVFGLASLKDLPKADEFKAPEAKKPLAASSDVQQNGTTDQPQEQRSDEHDAPSA